MLAAVAGKPRDTHPPRRDDSEAGTGARLLSPALGANEEQQTGEAAAGAGWCVYNNKQQVSGAVSRQGRSSQQSRARADLAGRPPLLPPELIG